MRLARRLFLLVLAAVLVAACSDAPCVCPSAPDATVAATPLTPTVVGDSPRAQLALEITGQLFARDFVPVRAHFTRALGAELSAEKLGSIMVGLTQAHGQPVQIMDAWSNTIKEDDVSMPGAQVVVKMANDTRLGVKLVFEQTGELRGLWIRPI